MGEKQRNRFLVFSSVGDQNQVSRWIANDRGYDVAIAYYGDSEFAFRDSVEYFIRSKDVKIPNFLKCVWEFEDLLNYDYYLLVDDDILVDAATIEAVFKTAVDCRLELCQPSLSEDSATNWPQLKHKAGIRLEFTNFVEVQCFCLSKRLLQKALPYFSFIKSGFALDLILSGLLGHPKDKIAILHHLQMKHPPKDERLSVVYAHGLGPLHEKLDKILKFCLGRDHQAKSLLADFVFQSYGTKDEAGSYHLNRFQEKFWARLKRAALKLGNVVAGVGPGCRAFLGGRISIYPRFNFTREEKKMLFNHLSPEKKYLEYGAGRNTAEIVKRVGHVMSVEHDPAWHALISKEAGPNARVILCPPSGLHFALSEGGTNWNFLSFEKFLEKDGSRESFKNYIETVKEGPFDVILVDGRARLYCLEYIHTRKLLNPGGILFVHDYDREWLRVAELWFKKTQVVDRLAMFTWPDSSGT